MQQIISELILLKTKRQRGMYKMTGRELKTLVDSGAKVIVEFTDLVEDLETRFENRMRAYATNVNIEGDMVKIFFEEREFAEYNRTMEQPTWRNHRTGEFNMKWSEDERNANYDGKASFFEMLDEEVCNFTILENDSMSLFQRYLNEDSNISYVRWLEELVLSLDSNK